MHNYLGIRYVQYHVKLLKIGTYKKLLHNTFLMLCIYSFCQGDTFPQVVVGYDPELDDSYHTTCGVIITSDNWLDVIRIPVVAKIDGSVDGEQIRIASIWSSISYTSVQLTVNIVNSVTVSMHNRNCNYQLNSSSKTLCEWFEICI